MGIFLNWFTVRNVNVEVLHVHESRERDDKHTLTEQTLTLPEHPC